MNLSCEANDGIKIYKDDTYQKRKKLQRCFIGWYGFTASIWHRVNSVPMKEWKYWKKKCINNNKNNIFGKFY